MMFGWERVGRYYKKVCKNVGEEERWDSVLAWSPFPPRLFTNTDVLQTNKEEFWLFCQYLQELKLIILWMYFHRFSSSDYWFNQMYYGTHGPFKRAEGGQAITFENDKVQNFIPSPWKLLGFILSTPEVQLQGLWSLE